VSGQRHSALETRSRSTCRQLTSIVTSVSSHPARTRGRLVAARPPGVCLPDQWGDGYGPPDEPTSTRDDNDGVRPAIIASVRITAKSDYAIRALIELAAENGTMLTCDYIAQQQGILTDLRHAGLITSHRGAEGGYLLARPARTITVADVIRIVDGPLASVHGERPQDVQYEGNAAILQPLWVAVRASLRGVLENVTIAHLANGQLPPKVARLTEDDDAWKDH
jgi:Rrf2 family protein